MSVGSWPGSPEPPQHPEIPYPPARPIPRREGPVAIPVVDVPSGDAASQLFARRRVLVSGVLDVAAATQAAAELMSLDGRSSDDVELCVNSDGGPLADVLAVIDVIGSMRATVHTRCIGRARGTAAVLVACGTGVRRCAARALISLRCSAHERFDGGFDDLRSRLEELELIRRQVVDALVARTGRDAGELRAALDDGPLLEPGRARELGLVDVVEDVRAT